MKFLVDAQLPRSLARQLGEAGHDALHTLELPDRNQTSDAQISLRADAEERIVVSKDADFVVTHTLTGRPRRLLLIATGNIGNRELADLLLTHLAHIEAAFGESSFVELGRAALSIRR